ncbi:MAG: Anucleate primary sterigmata protein B [Claussenomyces sp. TS43310]|nr:MAG: Anucleate primary sterigmata protein B [Claussenomyces sp. TS43310]
MEDSHTRPQTARKDSRKVPGGFDAEDLDDLSPTKQRFDMNVWDNVKAPPSNLNRLPSLDLANLPSLPHADSSSFYPASDGPADQSDVQLDSLDEKEMRKHLMNIESSFLSAPSPISAPNTGADDTYLFDAAPKVQGARGQSPYDQSQGLTSVETFTPRSPPTPAQNYKTPTRTQSNTPEPSQDSVVGDSQNAASSSESMSSSPTARAAARTFSRTISADSLQGRHSLNDEDGRQSAHGTDDGSDLDLTPKRKEREKSPQADSADEKSTIRHADSNDNLRLSADAESIPAAAQLSRRSSARKPKFLRSRYSSQRSSTSSFLTNADSHDEISDLTMGVDYALQSGGAVPADGMHRGSSFALSRSISLGSMASGMDDSTSHGELPSGDRALATLDEEERNRERKYASSKRQDVSPGPETPRPPAQTLTAPTDTVIARHVRNVHVPESVAKEYRSKNQVDSPDRPSAFSAPLGRHGKNLTLKEQSSTIERLSKENFDLKLKVMFLSDRLDKLSEEGVKEMISENVDLKTALANMQRDNKGLRRKVRDLEQKLKDEEDRPSTARSGASSDDRSPQWFDQEGAQEREEELTYLRERVEEYVTEIEKMRGESLLREAEKRKLAEVVRTMGEKRGENLEAREEMDVWKDLLEQETARREQSDEDNRKLRDEIFRLKTEASGNSNLNFTTDIYNITKRRQISPSRPRSGYSDRVDDRTGTFSSASTLAEELRKESEHLRHENAELRREVGAQTSMLTSRNREKERLYQEIEDLKLAQRRGGGSVAGESILDRSASRTRNRSQSRASGLTKQTGLAEAEREDFENKHAELRDKINVLRMQNQDLQYELDTCMQDFETAVQAKQQAESLARDLQEELEAAENDLQTMQADRDEALRGQEEVEIEFESLRKEAQEEIDALESEAEQRNEEFMKTQAELADRTENFDALQVEMRAMSEALVRLEDEQETKMRRIQELEQEIDEANLELEEMEKNLVESNGKVNRLLVQQESSQGEIAFLREEQDGDKIKIGDLEAAIRNAEASLQDEKERAKDLEQRLANERKQRELVANKEKQEVQKIINDLNREASGAKDEARHLRRRLTKEEVEAAAWKARLTELENNLREALGDLDGTRASLLQSVENLQRQLEDTMRDLDSTRASVSEKDRLIKQRDSLLESHGLESRRQTEMLDKERQSHRNTRNQFEAFQKTHQHVSRTVTQQESRVQELEMSRQLDRKKLAQLESSFREQLTERNNLLLTLWNRLSALCGSDWAHDNRLINGRALPSLEVVSTMLPGFSKNLLAATKTIESMVGGFQTRIKTVERDLWKEYQNVEQALDVRVKKLDRLETLVKSGVSSGASDSKAEMVSLKDTNRLLRAELASLRNVDNRTRTLLEPGGASSPSPSIPTGPRSRKSDRTSTLTRHHSSSTVETATRVGSSSAGSSIRAGSSKGGASDEADDQRWIFRFQELERRLAAEREARLLDRKGAMKRLQEAERRNEELRMEVERGKVKHEMAQHRV